MDKHDKDRLLETFMIEYGDELVRLAYTYVRDKETAKDLIQNTFIKCYEHVERFRYDASVKTWLYRIAINECKDYLKSWHYRKIKAVQTVEEMSKSLVLTTEKAVVEKTNNEQLKMLVDDLPRSYREVILLYYYHSLSIKEIVEATGLKENTVKTRLRRARQRLKLKVKEAEIYG